MCIYDVHTVKCQMDDEAVDWNVLMKLIYLNFPVNIVGDVIIQQFTSFLSVVGREEFVSFQPLRQRLDVFLHSKLCTSHPDLLKFCQSALLLSHGQATVERGFSINKEVETCNLHDESLEALRLICDKVIGCGGIHEVPLTKELLASAASARSQYRLYLENERKNKESATRAEEESRRERAGGPPEPAAGTQ